MAVRIMAQELTLKIAKHNDVLYVILLEALDHMVD